MNFPEENTYSTYLDLDKYRIRKEEANKLRKMMREIISLSSLKIPENIQRLDEIFQEEIPSMECGKILKEVIPSGGKGKNRALFDSLKRTGGKISGVLYVGDSITDVEILNLVKENKGIAISFNGNRYALKAAEIACISPDTFPLTILIKAFHRGGRGDVLRLINDFSKDEKEQGQILALIDEDDMETLCQKSENMRKKVRGEKLGGLG